VPPFTSAPFWFWISNEEMRGRSMVIEGVFRVPSLE
jgi:hypothetical protein